MTAISLPLKSYLKKHAALVDKGLDRLMATEKTLPHLMHKAMRYSVFAGGKRLRPILCMAAAELSGLDGRKVLPTACALEIIHTYSLVHDDLPAMDDDDLRRGRPTNHKVFGEGIAILAGDGLLTYGFELIARNAETVKAERVVKALAVIAKAVGSQGMVGGQAVDLTSAGGAKNGSRAALLDYIHRHKTGALLTGSLISGATLAGASPKILKAFEVYGDNIGLAFQIADDILDIVGNKTLLGKRGSDAENDKLTYPAVYGLEESRRRALAAVAGAKKALEPFGRRGDILADLADYIIHREN